MGIFLKKYATYSGYQSAGNDNYVREIVPGVALVKDRYDLGTEPNVFYNAPNEGTPRFRYDLEDGEPGYHSFHADNQGVNPDRWDEAGSDILPLVQANYEGTVTPFLIDIYVGDSLITTLDETCDITYTYNKYYTVTKNLEESRYVSWQFETGNESNLNVTYYEGGV